jgi:hypothetical protein
VAVARKPAEARRLPRPGVGERLPDQYSAGMPRRPRLWIPAVAVVAGLAVALLTDLPPFEGKPESPAPGEVCPVASIPGASVPSPQPYDTDGADYAGAAPHPVVVIDTGDLLARLRDGTSLESSMASRHDEQPWRLFEPPTEWQPPDEEDRSKVQLVACVYYDAVERPLSWCHYRAENGTFSLAPVRLTVVVREASTGRTVGEFPLRSDLPTTPNVGGDLASDYCPGTIPGVPASGTEGAHTWMLPPRRDDFLAGLRPLVERQF